MLNNINERTSDKIKKIRLEKGFTQKQLAEKCGMYESQIRKYEAGKANPKIETLQRIANALDVPLSALKNDLDLLCESVTNYFDFHAEVIKAAIKEENTLLEHYRQLNTDGRTEAQKRVQELTEIKKYTEGEEPQSE